MSWENSVSYLPEAVFSASSAKRMSERSLPRMRTFPPTHLTSSAAASVRRDRMRAPLPSPPGMAYSSVRAKVRSRTSHTGMTSASAPRT